MSLNNKRIPLAVSEPFPSNEGRYRTAYCDLVKVYHPDVSEPFPSNEGRYFGETLTEQVSRCSEFQNLFLLMKVATES
jgi:hypothetical protein